MHILGVPLVSSQQTQTPLQATFLAEALPRVDMKRQGMDPDDPDGDNKGKSAAKEGTSELSRLRREKNKDKRK